ncbi:hypothetical protein DFH08DRAFT_953353 [Mycena albidolilacea]|uniref:Uncharacterized protein n=1 Tax=Mycena albidolilacea TaxID=1033008 RepID=A0AAD7EYG9_9AGAR|nr:hypothetical protein DFH08DRAFT_953353 [Mycena albidolilacea]
MSDILIPICEPSASLPPSSTTTSASRPRSGSLRDRCGFTHYISFAPAFPNIRAKGDIGPTAGNIPRRRKRSSVASIDIPAAPAPVLADASAEPMEYFAIAA